MQYDDETIQRQAERLNLTGREKLQQRFQTETVCNGIGAAWFPAWLRRLLDRRHPTLVPVAWIHDLEYDEGGSRLDRLKADWHFLTNGFRAAAGTYAADQLRRYAVMFDALRFFVLLRIGGAPAFRFTGAKAGKR